MILTLRRRQPSEQSTEGELFVDGVWQCYALEPGLIGKGAIPAGTYNIDLTFSPRFARVMPLVENVPGFDGIRIHPGNTPSDTEGCILVGSYAELNQIDWSAKAFINLFDKLNIANKNSERITIQIIDALKCVNDNMNPSPPLTGSGPRSPSVSR